MRTAKEKRLGELDAGFKSAAGEHGSQKSAAIAFRGCTLMKRVSGDPCLPGRIGFEALMK